MNIFKRIGSTVGVVVNSAALIFKGGEIVKEAIEAADSVKVLRRNVAMLITKYSKAIKKDAPDDIKSLFRDLDRVTEETADVAKAVGLTQVEANLRQLIKSEMYI